MNAPLRRTIWFMWLAGMDRAPLIPRRCLEAWRRFNPGWSIRVVTRESIGQYLDLAEILGGADFHEMEVQALSNVIRLNLLARYGGVWSDASVLCRRPLDAWLPPLVQQERFFAFDRPHPGRPIATWFFYGDPGSRLLARLTEVSNAFWRDNPHRSAPSSAVAFRRRKFPAMSVISFDGREKAHGTSPEAGVQWGEHEVRAVVRALCSGQAPDWTPFEHVHPYFWMHYLFGELLRLEPDLANSWDRTPRISAVLPHLIQHQPMAAPPDEAFRRTWHEGISPVYKLNMWRASEVAEGGAFLDFVLDPANW